MARAICPAMADSDVRSRDNCTAAFGRLLPRGLGVRDDPYARAPRRFGEAVSRRSNPVPGSRLPAVRVLRGSGSRARAMAARGISCVSDVPAGPRAWLVGIYRTRSGPGCCETAAVRTTSDLNSVVRRGPCGDHLEVERHFIHRALVPMRRDRGKTTWTADCTRSRLPRGPGRFAPGVRAQEGVSNHRHPAARSCGSRPRVEPLDG